MKLSQRNQQNIVIAAGAGFVGFALRALLYRIGFDEKNILSSSHPLHLITLVLTVAVAGYLLFRLPKAAESGEAQGPWGRFVAGLLGGYFLFLHGIALAGDLSGLLTVLNCAGALVGAGAMILCVFPPLKSQRVQMICHGLITVVFALDMLCRYRGWSGNPQLPDYVFHVLCSVCLSLCSYHRLAVDADLGKPRVHSFFCLMALYLCPLCLIGPEGWEFYLGGAFWAVACLFIPVTPTKEDADVSA